MKKTKKLIAIVLCIVLCAGLIPAAAFAKNEPAVCNLVTVGDSTANGYYLNDYGSKSDATWGWGDGSDNYGVYDQSSKKSFSFLLRDYLKEKLGSDYSVKLTNLTFEGLRTDELRATLDPSFLEKAEARGDYFCTSHMESYNYWYWDNYEDIFSRGFTEFNAYDPSFSESSKPLFTAVFEDALSKADIIVLDNVMNNFGTYFSSRLMGILGMEDASLYSEPVSSLADELDINVAEVETMMTSLVKQFMPGDTSELISQVIDLFVYCYCDFRINFAKNIELIRALNSDAQLIVLGPYNALNGLKVSIDGTVVDLGALWSAYMGLVSIYITTICPMRSEYSFADCSVYVESFADDLRKTESINKIYPRYKELILSDLMTEDVGVSEDEVLEAVLAAAKLESLDAVGAMALLDEGYDVETAAKKAAYDWENASDAEKAMLYVYCTMFSAHGMGSHPSESGCAGKFKAIKAAVENNEPEGTDGIKSMIGTAAGVFGALLQVFNVPIIESISDVLNSIGNAFFDFLDMIGQSIEALVMSFIPSR